MITDTANKSITPGRYNIEDGIDLFAYLTEEDKIHSDYLEMLLTSIRRPDLVEHVQR